jgi:uncharacterized protein YjbI with pentapeptide repeats
MQKFTLEELNQFISYYDNPVRDYSAYDSSQYSGILSRKHLSNLNFPKISNLNGFYAIESIFENVIFSEIDLFGIFLNDSKFINCIFENVNFTKSELLFTQIEQCIFRKCTFLCTVMESQIKNTIITESEFTLLNWSDTDLENIILSNNWINPNYLDEDQKNIKWTKNLHIKKDKV